MAIHVTPIPKLTTLTTPAFTLGTANAAGDALTAVASNSTLLAFDTTLPTTTAATSVVGSATTTTRRDHVHATLGTLSTVVAASRTALAGAGAQAITGAGFAPTSLVVFGVTNGTASASWGLGDDAAGEGCSYMIANGNVGNSSTKLLHIENSGTELYCVLTSMDADGCTVTWTKNGSPGDVYFKILFFR
jgi:hypothetical protein